MVKKTSTRTKNTKVKKTVTKRTNKKKVAKKTESPISKKKKPPTTSEGVLKLRKDQVTKWRMLEAETTASKAKLERLGLELQLMLQSIPEVVRLQGRILSATEDYKSKVQTVRQYLQELGNRLGVDFGKVAIDQATGAIHELPKET